MFSLYDFRKNIYHGATHEILPGSTQETLLKISWPNPWDFPWLNPWNFSNDHGSTHVTFQNTLSRFMKCFGKYRIILALYKWSKPHSAKYACSISSAIYIHHSVTCQYIKLYWPPLVGLHIQMCRLFLTSEVSLRISSLQPTCLCLWHMIDDEAHCYTMFSAVVLLFPC